MTNRVLVDQNIPISMRDGIVLRADVYQDSRGRLQSDGDFYPLIHEGRDGYDTVEWVTAQPWYDGAASALPIYPSRSFPGDRANAYTYIGGDRNDDY